MAKFDIYQAVTDQILTALDGDIIPWRKPWVVRNGRGGNAVATHINLHSKRPYRGINVFLLEVAAMTNGWTSPYWLSFKQVKDKGGTVRKGEHGTLVVFWKPSIYTPKNGVECPKCHQGNFANGRCDNCGAEKVQSLILRYYKVFNVEQCDDIEPPVSEPEPEDETEDTKEFDPIAEAEAIITNMPKAPRLRYGGGRAAYAPGLDIIMMPDRIDFHSSEAFYSTLFHEHVHATGHKERLDRKDAFKGSFGDADYAREELVAEMGASMLCAIAGVENELDQSASYIRHWMTKADYQAAIKKDKKLVIFAAARAQKAADFILGDIPEDANGEDA